MVIKKAAEQSVKIPIKMCRSPNDSFRIFRQSRLHFKKATALVAQMTAKEFRKITIRPTFSKSDNKRFH